MPVFHQCDRCKQTFSCATRLATHKNRVRPCLVVDMPVADAIAEHERLTKVLDLAEKATEDGASDATREKANEAVKEENKDQSKELAEYKRAQATPEKLAKVVNPFGQFQVNYNHDVILKLDPKTGNSTVLFGSSKSGKSTCLMRIYEKYYKKSVCVLFTESPQLKLYRDSKLVAANNFYPDVVRDMHTINKKTKNKYKFACFLDDIVTCKENTMIRKMILVLRNSNISSVVSLQDCKLFNKQNRGSVNNYLFFHMNTEEAAESVIRLFLTSHLPGPMEQKIKMYRMITANHGFIYYNPREDSVSFHRLNL